MVIIYASFAKAIMDFNIVLTKDEVIGLLNILNELPTKTGVYPIIQKIGQQANEQSKQLSQPNPESAQA